ncbi:DEAD/DEAH box helicase [Streptomyces sp. NPDC059837]|jgi:superfamily II DNA/RNA helicase|uniref:DEAD/DEAH box helicase n=1 Tax=unclassified Streptomyces TaxID=2593676 RepID=UPI0022532CBE|nr:MULTISPECIES: DEAD/DEAH box helicase [unclassified Streptomyces]MCX4402503.1 DEAD/DEAH box helicase [Streptomyces sp. NBC_01764]MCX5182523.1 DEAD/DEAH box helicase [Streptomyces sp. NBC_00268]
MNRSARTGDRFSKTRKDGFAGSGGGARSRPQGGQGRPGARSGGNGRGPSAPQGEFALPETITPALPAVATFGELDLPVELLETLTSLGVNEPFPIQAATLPNSLAGRDVLGRGRTGSGKTLAFGLALLVRTAGRRAEARKPLALILVPTRELAQQVCDALTPYARLLKLRLATVVGGMSIGRQAGALRTGAEVVVATPGRLMDLVERNDCRLDRVGITVLDEADQMADMGFMPQVTELLDQVRPDGQRLLFSATLDRNIDLLVRRYLHDPVVHSVDPSAGAVTTMEHHVLQVHGADKYATATEIAARDGRVLMFLDTKHAVDQFTRHLLGSGVKAAALHSGKSQPQRTRTLAQFKTGHITTLVATNVAARGIHVDDLDLVVNVDPPSDHKDYLHRGGRTARAGESGSVVTLVLPGQRRDVIRLMSDAGIRPHVTQVRSGEAELSRITGAQAPSGVPIGGSRPVTERPERGGAPFRGLGTRPGRAGGESRRAAEARQTAEARKAARVRRGA